jgi:hypothetical protein
MIHSIPKPKISSQFTVDDIHKIREWNYERTKDASFEEYVNDIKKDANQFLRRIDSLKNGKTAMLISV